MRDLYHLDESGFAPTLPTSYTWAREGIRPLVAYEAPQGRRVNVIGALAAVGPTPRLVWTSRQSGQGRLDSAAFLDFVVRQVAGLPAAWDALPPEYVRPRPCTIVVDNYSVHRSKAVQAAASVLAQAGVTFAYLPPYSPKLSSIEPVWRHVKYTDLATRSFADASTLQDAVDTALANRAAALCHPTHKLPRAA
jgi:transposase